MPNTVFSTPDFIPTHLSAKIYLVPTPISELVAGLPSENREILDTIDNFVVENLRTARRFLARQHLSRSIDELTFTELNEHTPPEQVEAMLAPLMGATPRSIAILSEAGLPCVADPGALLVAAAHRRGIEVVPMVGPSSIMLALMASGMNGQSFAFNGYLPIKQPDRNKAIRHFEARARAEGQSQIFIEAPYRNVKLFEDMISACATQTMLCVACDLLGADQLIISKSVAQWRREPMPAINKRPAIFIIG